MCNELCARRARILFIGNSYTSRHNLPLLFAEIAASSVIPTRVETETIVAGGASLKQHWNAPEARTRLGGSSWNYVVLQEQSTLPLKSPKRFHDSVRLFDIEIKAHRAQTVLYLTWARAAAPGAQDALTKAVFEIAKEIDALVVPVGPAWQIVSQQHPGLPLYEKDGSHPTPLGSYLAACVFYTILFRASPMGLAVPERLGLCKETAARLQRVAAKFADRVPEKIAVQHVKRK